jgi:hypothetical protein
MKTKNTLALLSLWPLLAGAETKKPPWFASWRGAAAIVESGGCRPSKDPLGIGAVEEQNPIDCSPKQRPLPTPAKALKRGAAHEFGKPLPLFSPPRKQFSEGNRLVGGDFGK